MTSNEFAQMREVTVIPPDYEAWNIGPENGAKYPGYLICCKVDKCHNCTDFVKIKTPHALEIYDGLAFGSKPQEMRDLLSGKTSFKNSSLQSFLYQQKPKIRIALHYLEKLYAD